MAAPRLLYLAALLGSFVFYIASGEWLSWLLLLTVLGFPWLSLLLSLGAIRRFHAAPSGPDAVLMGTDAELCLVGSCSLPMPPFHGKLRLRSCFTGNSMRYHIDKGLPSDHCGAFTVTVEKGRVCDYLGLFSFPVAQRAEKTVFIHPIPIPIGTIPDLQRCIAQAWQPKPGGGYAENHELRLYRPGDQLKQVHWKLSAKTGKLILREAMEPRRGLVLLTMNLQGSPEELDRKLGRLLWLGSHIARQNIPYVLRVLTGEGLLSFEIKTEPELQRAMDTLLCSSLTAEGDIRSQSYGASWHYHIGGQPDEAG